MTARQPPEVPRTAIAFRTDFLDFHRGIRVGNLADNERITRLLKLSLEERYGQPFVTERWGRGVYWRWIGFLPRANREVKPVSNHVSFGCAKFFIMVDTDEQRFQCGMQVERGYIKAPPDRPGCELRDDWDWHRLLRALRPRGPMGRELKRLVREGFEVHAGSWDESSRYSAANYPGAGEVGRQLERAPGNRWAGFQIFYSMGESDVRGIAGVDLIDSMMAIFYEVTPAMNLCMQIELAASPPYSAPAATS